MANSFYPMVPKDLQANLRFRADMVRLGSSDVKAARELWTMCSRDLLFYVNTFGWTYDPRKTPSAIPFITWPFQDEALLTMDACIGFEDFMIRKSRDMGASWMTLLVCEYRWHFRDFQSFLMVSRKEDLVDSPGDPDSLFWKVDFLHKHQPPWLLPRMTRTRLHFGNDENGSTIDGESTNGDVGRGGRRTAVVLDEFAAVENGREVLSATADVTKTRIFASTPKGTATAFYKIGLSKIRKLTLHWSLHPEKAAGLYATENAKPKIINADFSFPADYKFIADGKLRSPWYDAECERRAHAVEIAQELDINDQGSQYQHFDPAQLDRLQAEHCRPAFLIGELDFTKDTFETVKFVERPSGRLKLWCNLDPYGKPALDRKYVVGGDIAMGTGASNSALSGADCKTREKVAEFVDSRIDPTDLAEQGIAMAKFFGDAHLIWEANGPGRTFGNRVIKLGYRNVHYRKNEQSLSGKQTDHPGWNATKDNKNALLTEYRAALTERKFINRSFEAIEECREYIVDGTQRIVHSASKDNEDPTGANDAHGDRVIADALCFYGMDKTPAAAAAKVPETPLGSFMWRRERRAQVERELEEEAA